MSHVKNNDDPRLLGRQQRIDAERRALAVINKKRAKARRTTTAMLRIANARRAS